MAATPAMTTVCRLKVTTSLGTRMLISFPSSSTVNKFKEALAASHAQDFPDFGKVVVDSLETFDKFRLSGSSCLGDLFDSKEDSIYAKLVAKHTSSANCGQTLPTLEISEVPLSQEELQVTAPENEEQVPETQQAENYSWKKAEGAERKKGEEEGDIDTVKLSLELQKEQPSRIENKDLLLNMEPEGTASENTVAAIETQIVLEKDKGAPAQPVTVYPLNLNPLPEIGSQEEESMDPEMSQKEVLSPLAKYMGLKHLKSSCDLGLESKVSEETNAPNKVTEPQNVKKVTEGLGKGSELEEVEEDEEEDEGINEHEKVLAGEEKGGQEEKEDSEVSSEEEEWEEEEEDNEEEGEDEGQEEVRDNPKIVERTENVTQMKQKEDYKGVDGKVGEEVGAEVLLEEDLSFLEFGDEKLKTTNGEEEMNGRLEVGSETTDEEGEAEDEDKDEEDEGVEEKTNVSFNGTTIGAPIRRSGEAMVSSGENAESDSGTETSSGSSSGESEEKNGDSSRESNQVHTPEILNRTKAKSLEQWGGSSLVNNPSALKMLLSQSRSVQKPAGSFQEITPTPTTKKLSDKAKPEAMEPNKTNPKPAVKPKEKKTVNAKLQFGEEKKVAEVVPKIKSKKNIKVTGSDEDALQEEKKKKKQKTADAFSKRGGVELETGPKKKKKVILGESGGKVKKDRKKASEKAGKIHVKEMETNAVNDTESAPKTSEEPTVLNNPAAGKPMLAKAKGKAENPKKKVQKKITLGAPVFGSPLGSSSVPWQPAASETMSDDLGGHEVLSALGGLPPAKTPKSAEKTYECTYGCGRKYMSSSSRSRHALKCEQNPNSQAQSAM